MILVTGIFRLPVENLAAGRAAMARVIAASRTEPGCLAYAYAEDVIEPGLFRVSEAWTSREALAAHFDTPHMKEWLRERAEMGLTDRDVIAYTVSGKEAL
ncbi:MAG TPA: putative quinol monooxygenase [Novosphingobium sp.]